MSGLSEIKFRINDLESFKNNPNISEDIFVEGFQEDSRRFGFKYINASGDKLGFVTLLDIFSRPIKLESLEIYEFRENGLGSYLLSLANEIILTKKGFGELRDARKHVCDKGNFYTRQGWRHAYGETHYLSLNPISEERLEGVLTYQ